MTIPPSGQPFPISGGGYEAVIVEVGGGLRCLTHERRPLVDGYADDAMCEGARGQLLLPWPNRIENGAYRFNGSDHQLPVNESATGCAIHGLTRWATWSCVDHSVSSVTMGIRLHPQPGWPGVLELSALYRVDHTGLSVHLSARNVGESPLPFGAGAHPYLLAGDGPIDDWTLQLSASKVARVDASGIPSGSEEVDGTPFDFRAGKRIGDLAIDHPFTNLARDDDGRAWARLHSRDGRCVSLWADHHHRWFQVYTGHTLSDPTRRRTALAIEPMTCPPNAFRTGEDLIVLEPDECSTLEWGIEAAG